MSVTVLRKGVMMTNNQSSEVKRNSLNKSGIDVKLEPMTNQSNEMREKL